MKRTVILLFAVALASVVLAAGQLTNMSRKTSVGPKGALELEADNGDIQITVGFPTVQVEVVGLNEKNLKDLTIEETPDLVRILYKPDGWGSNVKFKIGVPEAFNLNLKTAGGDISVEGGLTGTVNAKTAGGDIQVEDLNGDVALTTAGGDITAGSVDGAVQMKTAGGDISLTTATGEVELKTSGGDIHVGDVDMKLTASTAGGDIILKNVGGSAEVQTAGGDVRVGNVSGNALLKTAGGDIALESATGPVEAKTAGGDLDLKGLGNSVIGATSGGDISAEITGPGDNPSELKTAGGDIRLDVYSLDSVRIEALIRIQGDWETRSEKLGIWVNGTKEVQRAVKDAGRREIRATIGQGSYLINVTTSDGNIHINGGALR